MRERVHQGAPGAQFPLALPDLVAEAHQIARLLRLGHDDPALERLGPFTARIGGALAELSRQPGGPPGGADIIQKVLKALQEVSLCEARLDHIGIADVLEHQVARYLSTAA